MLAAAVLEQIESGAGRMKYSTVLEETERVCFNIVEELLKKTSTHPSEVSPSHLTL